MVWIQLPVLKPKTAGTPLDIRDVATTTELFLLQQEWGQVNQVDILAFNTAIKASVCPVDQINNKMACKFLRDSVSQELKRSLDQALPIETSAAYMLWTIIQKVQGTNSTAGRQILHEIEAMRLTSQAA